MEPRDYATALNVFGLWSAGMTLVITTAVVGVVVILLRVRRRVAPTETSI